LTGVTVTTGAVRVVSAVVSFFEESTTQPARRKSGRREAGRGKREGRKRKECIGIVEANGAPVWKLKS
jgi:hypothetical protein